ALISSSVRTEIETRRGGVAPIRTRGVRFTAIVGLFRFRGVEALFAGHLGGPFAAEAALQALAAAHRAPGTLRADEFGAGLHYAPFMSDEQAVVYVVSSSRGTAQLGSIHRGTVSKSEPRVSANGHMNSLRCGEPQQSPIPADNSHTTPAL